MTFFAFQNGISLLGLIRLEDELSLRLGRKVDLITEGAIKNKRIKDNISNDLQQSSGMKDDIAFIEHILLCIDKIQEYTKNLTAQDFNNSELIQDAVIRNIEIIGEATKKISKDLKSQYLEIPWKEMFEMRDKLIHDYFGIDVDVVRKTVNEDIPFLKSLIENLINKNSR